MSSRSGPTPEEVVKERLQVIQKLAQSSKSDRAGFENPNDQERALLDRLDVLLNRLDTEVIMTPDFKEKSKIDTGLKLIFDDSRFKFRQDHVERARKIYEKWESENWGTPVVVNDSSSEQNQSDVQMNSDDNANGNENVRRKRKRSNSTSETEQLQYKRLPPRNHPIWGVNGIMHGICKSYNMKGHSHIVRDPRYLREQRPANHFGHNGLTVGDWFPFLLNALFRGGHGYSQAGIYGDQSAGAYSILVSAQYDELDKDRGEQLLYSGSRSHDNTDPRRPAPSSNGTLALHASLATGNPVRVFRSSTGKTAWAPPVGYRYDGLYRVVELRYPHNDKGGMYEQFKLVRVEGQAPIDRSRPSAEEMRDFHRIDHEYPRA